MEISFHNSWALILAVVLIAAVCFAALKLKKKYGEASLDLYYNNYDDNNPFVAKVHSAINACNVYHGRAKDFGHALDLVEIYYGLIDVEL